MHFWTLKVKKNKKVFGSKKIKGSIQDSQNWLRSLISLMEENLSFNKNMFFCIQGTKLNLNPQE